MANVFDYLQWRGDLSFARAHFCDVDALVLSRFAYFPLDDLVPEKGPSVKPEEPEEPEEPPKKRGFWDAFRRRRDEPEVAVAPALAAPPPFTIAQAWDAFLHREAEAGEELFLNVQDRPLFEAMAKSKRFGPLPVFGFENHLDVKAGKQFSAVTVLLKEDVAFVAYRGTDNTVVGWQEDFNMGFMHPVPAQEDAVQYLKRIAGETGGARIRTGGHSKGGNLAVYAPAFAGAEVQARVLSIHNLDGPGFLTEILEEPAFQAIAPRIQTFLPQSSIVGMLLDHEDAYTVVHSTGAGLMQHNVYSWEVLGPAFVQLERVTGSSTFVNKSLKEWIARLTPEERQAFSQALTQLLSAMGVTKVSELKQNFPQRALDLVNSLRGVSPEARSALLKTASALVQSALSTAWSRWNQGGKEPPKAEGTGE